MRLTRPSVVKQTLDELGVRPNRTYSQNFLVDANILRILLDAADLHKTDCTLEIGAGLGVVTEALAARTGHVIAIEKDPVLFGYLQQRFARTSNVELIRGDATQLDLQALLERGITRVVSNLPYMISSRMLYALADTAPQPERIVVTVQKEVAQRLSSAPGSREYGLLSVVCGLRYQIRTVKVIAPGCFYPPPDVKSAIVELTRRDHVHEPRNRREWNTLLKTAFSQRRKQIAGVLAHTHPWRMPRTQVEACLQELGLDADVRPEQLAPEDWVRLHDALNAPGTA